MKINRFLSVFVSFCLIISCFVVFSVTASAEAAICPHCGAVIKHLSGYWRCPDCGEINFDETPSEPEMASLSPNTAQTIAVGDKVEFSINNSNKNS